MTYKLSPELAELAPLDESIRDTIAGCLAVYAWILKHSEEPLPDTDNRTISPYKITRTLRKYPKDLLLGKLEKVGVLSASVFIPSDGGRSREIRQLLLKVSENELFQLLADSVEPAESTPAQLTKPEPTAQKHYGPLRSAFQLIF